MIRQLFHVGRYWKVVVYYNLDYNFSFIIQRELIAEGAAKRDIEEVWDMLKSGRAKAVTWSNTESRVSIVLFNVHESYEDYLNSLVHEAEHIKQAMLASYYVEDKGEPPAYTVGYLVSRMYRDFKYFL